MEEGSRITAVRAQGRCERLRPGPHGRERSAEQVRAHQRARLEAAAIEVSFLRGCDHTTVAEIVARANVSKRTFYELFRGGQQCLLAACEALAQARLRELAAAIPTAPAPERVQALLGGVLDPQRLDRGQRRHLEAWAVAIEWPSIGAASVRGRAAWISNCARLVAASASDREAGLVLPALSARAIVHGMWFLLARRLLAGERETARMPVEELCEWVLACRCAASEPRLPAPIGDCANPAPALRRACPASLLDLGAVEALAAMMKAARRSGEDWPSVVIASVASLLFALSGRPALARVLFIDSLWSGRELLGRGGEILSSYAEVLGRRAPAPPRAQVVNEAIVGGVWGVIRECLLTGRREHLPALSGQLALFVLAPQIGAQRAMEVIRGCGSLGRGGGARLAPATADRRCEGDGSTMQR